TRGTPWTGARGITRTVSQIMAGRRTAATPRAPQAVGLTFLGGTLADSGLVPADAMGAAGTTQFVVGINGLIRTVTKFGTAGRGPDTWMDSFFGPVRGTSVATVPRVRYDRLSGRWFIVATSAVDHGTSALQPVNKVLLAVSGGGTITSSSSFTF